MRTGWCFMSSKIFVDVNWISCHINAWSMSTHMGMIYLSRQRSQWKVELGCRCLGFPRSATPKTSWQLWRGNFLQTLLKERGSRWFRHKQSFLHQWSPTTAYLEMSSSKPGWNQYYTELNNVILPYYQHQLKLMTDLCLIDKTQRHTYLLHVSIFFFLINHS